MKPGWPRRLVMGLYAAKSAVLVAAQLELGNVATRLFLHMALECWDEDSNPSGRPARRYFGRRELSAIALGFLAPQNGSDAAFQVVKRATRELVAKGAITRVRAAGNGHPAEFELQVDAVRPQRAGQPVPLPFLTHEGATDWAPQRVRF